MSQRLLLNVQVPLHSQDGQLYLEDQACNGLRLWAENFDHVTAMVPVRPGPLPHSWIPLDGAIASHADRLSIEPLPWAYRPDHHVRALSETRRKIIGLIEKADVLSFAIGECLFGDWGAVAARQATRMGRPHAIWTDRVESEVIRAQIHKGPWRRRLKARLTHRLAARLERERVKAASLGLFHGKETFDAYAPFCRNPHIVHDIHIAKEDHIPEDALTQKLATAGQGPLRIVYTGRMDPMKGPEDWVDVLGRLAQKDVAFEATWLGIGSQEDALKARVADLGLSDRVRFPGFVSDRAQVLDALRRAHIMMFCHKTPESPRCLIEALISGTPIVGYTSAFPEDLIGGHGGGVLTPLNDVAALAEAVTTLAQDRAALADRISRAAKDGAIYDDQSVFAHRSELIKAHL